MIRGRWATEKVAGSGDPLDETDLLYHMFFGYVIVRTLLPLVHALGRLGHSRGSPPP